MRVDEPEVKTARPDIYGTPSSHDGDELAGIADGQRSVGLEVRYLHVGTTMISVSKSIAIKAIITAVALGWPGIVLCTRLGLCFPPCLCRRLTRHGSWVAPQISWWRAGSCPEPSHGVVFPRNTFHQRQTRRRQEGRPHELHTAGGDRLRVSRHHAPACERWSP